MKKILLSEKISDDGINIITAAGFEVVVSPSTDEGTMKEAIKDAYGVIIRATEINDNIISAGKQLKIIVRHGTGIDNIDVKSATKHGVLVAKVDGANAYSVAEYVIGAILTLGRRLINSNDAFRNKSMCFEGGSLPGLAVKHNLNGYEIKGKTLGIIGMGKIGTILSQLASSLGLKVIAYDPYVKQTPKYVKLTDDVNQIYKSCEYISINVPLTKETENMISRKELAMMKPTACIINAGRGGIVNEFDLAEALNQNVIAGAALDVFLPEPPKANNPLLTAKNALLTAHIAGTTFEAGDALAIGAAQAIVDYSNGLKPQFTVNAEVMEHSL